MKRAARLNALPVFLDPSATTPLWLQLSISLRMAIANGRLRPGGRLASTRNLARQLNVSRNTVMAAYDQAQILDITGPLEVFSRASRLLADDGRQGRLPAYSVEVVAMRKGPLGFEVVIGGLTLLATSWLIQHTQL